MELLQAGAEKALSTADLEQLRRQIRQLDRRVRQELASRERHCAYCGARIGSSVFGSAYCCAWHGHVDKGHEPGAADRIAFERRRAMRRIRTVRKATARKLASMEGPQRAGYARLELQSRNVKIRKILADFTAITGRRLPRSAKPTGPVAGADGGA